MSDKRGTPADLLGGLASDFRDAKHASYKDHESIQVRKREGIVSKTMKQADRFLFGEKGCVESVKEGSSTVVIVASCIFAVLVLYAVASLLHVSVLTDLVMDHIPLLLFVLIGSVYLRSLFKRYDDE